MRWGHLLGGAPETGVEHGKAAEPEGSPPGAETAPAAEFRKVAPAGSPGRGGDRVEALEAEMAALRSEVANLKEEFDAFRRQFE